MAQSDESQQERILRAFTALQALRQDWGGALILACGLNPQGAALALASNIAGAVCLSIDGSPAALKEAMHSGSCDFIVNTLDEALRAMKNEVRRHRPLSVGLLGDTAQILQEILERGISPQLFTDFTVSFRHREVMHTFKSSGALVVDFDPNDQPEAEGILNADALVDNFTQPRQWRVRTFFFEAQSARREFDAHALSVIPEEDTLRRRWLQAVPSILQRERPIRRALWLTAAEEKTLQSASAARS